MTDVPVTPEIFSAIASGNAVDLKTASSILGLKYGTGRRRIYRDGLNIYRIFGKCYVRVSDLASPRLRVG